MVLLRSTTTLLVLLAPATLSLPVKELWGRLERPGMTVTERGPPVTGGSGGPSSANECKPFCKRENTPWEKICAGWVHCYGCPECAEPVKPDKPDDTDAETTCKAICGQLFEGQVGMTYEASCNQYCVGGFHKTVDEQCDYCKENALGFSGYNEACQKYVTISTTGPDSQAYDAKCCEGPACEGPVKL